MTVGVTQTGPSAMPLPDDIALLARAGAWPEFEERCATWQEAEGRTSDGMLLLAVAAYMRHDYASAIRYATQATEIPDATREAAEFLGLMQVLVGDLMASLFSIKLAEALPASAVCDLLPASLPGLASSFLGIENQPLIARAFGAIETQDQAAVEHWFRQQIEIDQQSEAGYLGLAYCLASQARFRESADLLRSARHALPDNAAIISQLGAALTALGEFRLGQACHDDAIARSGADAKIQAQALVDRMQDPDVALEPLTDDFRRWGETFGEKEDPWMPRPRALAKSRLTVGYLLSGLHGRSHARMLADIIAHHDEQAVRVVGLGHGALSEPVNAPFQRSVNVWQNIRGCDPYTLSAMVAAEDIDILVDASGFASPDTLTALGLRMAPVQLAWLGSPYGNGLAGCDAVISDSFLDPDTDGVVRLELGAAVTMLPPPIAPIAHDGLVLGADAIFSELCPRTVATWAAILRQLPAATLVLRNHEFANQADAGRLVELFGTFGVSHRVDVLSNGEHFFAATDICLLPYQTMRAEVVAEALASGVPMVGWLRDGRHRREAFSLLHYLGVASDTLAATDQDYVAMALGWVGNAERRIGFREKVDRSHPVLSPVARAADLGRVYRDLWQKALANAS